MTIFIKNKTFGRQLIIAGTTIEQVCYAAYISGYGLWLYPVGCSLAWGPVTTAIVVCRSVSNSDLLMMVLHAR